jgi:putative hydrolase of the HAD superfamily
LLSDQKNTPIKTVLFDADGVIQRSPQSWREQLQGLLCDTTKVEDFMADVFKAEKPCLTGHGDFPNKLEQVLRTWSSQATVETALKIWTNIEPDADVMKLVANIRANGTSVALATNQQNIRADFMTNELGYAQIFDHLFYSCQLGYAKPDPEYFLQIVVQLGMAAKKLLFLDDHESNVKAARAAGLHAEVFNLESGLDDLYRIFSDYDISVNPGES